MDNERLQNIPTQLKTLPQWVVRRGKCPINPATGQGAKAGQPDTWTTFERAVQASRKYDGIGFEFHNNGIVGIDIDHCIDRETGEIDPAALAIVGRMNSYTEKSPSGTGLHIYVYGDIPSSGRKNPKRNIEMYKEKRYFTVTGEMFGGCAEIARRPDEVKALYNELFPKPNKPASLRGKVSPQSPVSSLDRGLQHDHELQRLWSGERNTGDESSNDMALMNKLAYWCNRDAAAMVQAFRESPYTQQKDEKHLAKLERDDYLPRTAERAIADCQRTAADDRDEYRRNKVERAKQASQPASPITAESLKKYALNDKGAAQMFADTYRGRTLYLPEYKSYWTYKNGVWIQDKQDLQTRQLVKRWTDYVLSVIPEKQLSPIQYDPTTGKPPEDEWEVYRKHYGKYCSLRSRDNLIKDARDELAGYSTDFDRNPALFNCKNGTLNLENLKLLPHKPTDMLSKQANVNYDPAASCPRFLQFIEEITEGNEERANMFQKALGYALQGDANEECFFLALGKKTRNGKGTLFDSVMNVFGSYGAQMDFNTIARGGVKDGSRATPDLARLIGTRIVISNEPDKGVAINEALLKQLTGNDDITCRPLYGDTIQFKPAFKLFVTANSKPSVSDDSLFASDRIKMLPFTQHFKEDQRDTSLKALFRSEEAKSSILNWLLEGYRKYKEEGLRDTAEMKALAEEYRKENDYVGMFLDDRFDRDAPRYTTVKALRADYATWCGFVGSKPLGLKLFKEELEKHGLRITNAKGQFTVRGGIHSDFDYTGETEIEGA